MSATDITMFAYTGQHWWPGTPTWRYLDKTTVVLWGGAADCSTFAKAKRVSGGFRAPPRPHCLASPERWPEALMGIVVLTDAAMRTLCVVGTAFCRRATSARSLSVVLSDRAGGDRTRFVPAVDRHRTDR